MSLQDLGNGKGVNIPGNGSCLWGNIENCRDHRSVMAVLCSYFVCIAFSFFLLFIGNV